MIHFYRIIGYFLFTWCLLYISYSHHAHAQTVCNPNAPWVTQYGPVNVGDVMIYGPGCNQFQDGGGGSTVSISGATTIGNGYCGFTLLPNVATNVATYTITAPPAGTLNVGCSFSVSAPASRGVQLSVNGYSQRVLWPSQTITYQSTGSAWIIARDPLRWKPNTFQRLCVTQNGDDTQDGLVNGATSGGAGCLKTIQAAINIFMTQIDSNNIQHSIGLWAGGTGIFTESDSIVGQIVGSNLFSIDILQSVTWGSTSTCLTVSDQAQTIVNVVSGVLTLKCNTGNTSATGAFKQHQESILDVNGTIVWSPSGANDDMFFLDGPGRLNPNASGSGFILGLSPNLTGNKFINCNQHCAGVSTGGVVIFAGGLTLSAVFTLAGGSFISLGNSFSGTVTSGASPVSGNSVLITNGISVPNGTGATSGGQVCASFC